MWLTHGVRMVWLVNPELKTVEVHAPGSPSLRLTEDDTLDGDEVLPGFSCMVSEVFDL